MNRRPSPEWEGLFWGLDRRRAKPQLPMLRALCFGAIASAPVWLGLIWLARHIINW